MPTHIDLEASGIFLDPAHIGADLYDLNGFPGVVPGKGLVKGLLYRLEDSGLAPHLDAFEDIIPGDPEKSLYYRALTEVLDASGEPDGRLAWVYWFNRSVDGRPQITDGDWPLEAGTPQERGTV